MNEARPAVVEAQGQAVAPLIFVPQVAQEQLIARPEQITSAVIRNAFAEIVQGSQNDRFRILQTNINTLVRNTIRDLGGYVPWGQVDQATRMDIFRETDRMLEQVRLSIIRGRFQGNWALYYLVQRCWTNKAPRGPHRRRRPAQGRGQPPPPPPAAGVVPVQ